MPEKTEVVTGFINCPRCGQKVWATRVLGKPVNIPPHSITAKAAASMIGKDQPIKKDFTCR